MNSVTSQLLYETLYNAGYTNIAITKNVIRVYTNSSSTVRKRIMCEIAKLFDDAYINDESSYSSLGCIEFHNSNIKIVVKPSKEYSSLKDELHEIDLLNEQLINLTKNNKIINVKIGKNVYSNIIECKKVNNSSKADFVLTDNDKNHIWISHKDNKRKNFARGFQQWSGVSKANRKINSHKETRQFVKELYRLCDLQYPHATNISKYINDSLLQCYAVYGEDFGKQFGENNCTCVCQGHIILKPIDNNLYQLVCDKIFENGNTFPVEYKPTFYATYRKNRRYESLKNTRLGIYPLAYKNNSTNIWL